VKLTENQINQIRKYNLNLIFFATGVLLGSLVSFYELSIDKQVLVLGVIFTLGSLVHIYQEYFDFKLAFSLKESFFGFQHFFLLFFVGYLLITVVCLAKEIYAKNKPENLLSQQKKIEILGRIIDQRETFTLGEQTKQQIIIKDQKHGRVLIYLPKGLLLSKGDQVILSGKIKLDYWNLKNKNIKSSQYFYLKSKDLTYLITDPVLKQIDKENPKRFSLSYFREKFLEPHRLFLSKTNFVIIENLFLGRSSETDLPRVIRYKASTLGISHIFAASGLHLFLVGTFCFYLVDLLGFSHFYRSKLIFSLLCIFIYACLAEWSPSIVRAWFFSSLFLLSKILDRKINSINCLSVFLVISLLSEPKVISDLGFQFSVLGFLGIILLYQKLLDFFELLPGFLAKTFSITLSAQILILPLQLFYFQKIPVYFLVANFVVGALFSVCLFLLILISLLSFLPLSKIWQSFFSLFLSFFLELIQKIIDLIFSFELADLKVLSISLISVFLIYSIIFFALKFSGSLVFKNYTIAVLLFICLLESLYFPRKKENLEIRQISKSAILLKYKNLNTLICTDYQGKYEKILLKQKIRKLDLLLGKCGNLEKIYLKRKLKFSKQIKSIFLEENLKISFDERFALIDHQKFSALIQLKPRIGQLKSSKNSKSYTVFYKLFPEASQKTSLTKIKADFCVNLEEILDQKATLSCTKNLSNIKRLVFFKDLLKFF